MLVSASDDLKTAGLRVLAKLIAHDLVIKRQDNINKKNDKKVGAHKHWRVAGEGLS